jgi:hypothetical protein
MKDAKRGGRHAANISLPASSPFIPSVSSIPFSSRHIYGIDLWMALSVLASYLAGRPITG